MLPRAAIIIKINNSNIKIMKRPMSLNESQKKFIRTTGKRFTNTYLAELFGVGATQVLEYRREVNGLKKGNFRSKSDRYDHIIDFAKRKGYKNLMEAIDGFGNRETLMKEFKKHSA